MNIISYLKRQSARVGSSRARRPGFAPRLTSLERRELLTVYTVTNTSSAAAAVGSLPWAVTQANYVTHGLDYINFNIAGSGQRVITLDQTLYLNDQVVVDGTSQPGYSGTPLISVRGTASVPSLFLIQADPSQGTTSSGSTVQGLDLADFTSNGVTILANSSGNFIQNNWIGFYLDASGGAHPTTATFDQPTYFPAGVGIQSSFNTIRQNTITGLYNGIVVGENIAGTWSGTVYKTNSIQGDRIGSYPDGVSHSGFGNESDGIFVGAGGQQNFLGPDDVLSGNASSGAELLHPSVTGNVIFRDRIGTNDAGTAAVPNGELGVLIANGAGGNAIGGPFGGNIISANALGGVSLGTNSFGGAPGNYVQYNIIGLNGGQTAVVGTQNVGISIQSGASANTVVGNVIAGHTIHGVIMASTRGNYIAQNWIGRSAGGTAFANRAFGVALLSGASYNFVVSNAYGANLLGTVYVDPAAVGNSIH